jgi:type IV pilus assembly protein PilM
MMARAVGLDIGSRLLKLVELSGSAKAFKVHRLLVRPMPQGAGPEADQARVDLVRQVFQEAKVSRDDVCASFDAGSTVFREISVPFRDEGQIEKVVRFEAESHLHGRAIEDVVVNWVKTAETKDGSQVLVFAAPKVDLAQDLALLRRAGVEPASIDLDATALYTACQTAGVFRDDPSVVVLDVGARTSNLLIVDGGELRAVRAFAVGAESVTSGVQHDLSLPPGEASARVLEPRGGDGTALFVPAAEAAEAPGRKESSKSVAELERDATEARREQFVRKLERELRRSLAAVRTEAPATKILLSGGGSLLPGLADGLSQRMQVPVEPLGLLGRMGGWRPSGTDAALEEAVAPVAVGCALRILGVDPLGVELRQDEFAPSNTFDVVKTRLAIAVTLLVVLLLGMVLMAKAGYEQEREAFLTSRTGAASRAATIYQEVEKRYQAEIKNQDTKHADESARRAVAALTSDETYLQQVRGQLLRRYVELENNLGLSRDIPRIESASKVWKEIMASLNARPREEFGYLAITSMHLTQGHASLKVEMGEETTIDRVLAALNANAYFRARSKTPEKVWTRGPVSKTQSTGRWAGSVEIQFAEP